MNVQLAAGILLALFSMYTAVFGVFPDVVQRGIHLLLVLVIIFSSSFIKKSDDEKKTNKYLNLALLIISVISIGSLVINFEKVAQSFGAISTAELFMGIATIAIVLIATQRLLGNAMVMIAGFFIAYAILGPYFPGALQHRGYSISRVVSHLYLASQGIFGIPLGTSSTLVIMFVIFGSFLESSGGGKFFMDIAFSLTGKSRGGPAKAAVVSSALMGTISGSAAANVVTTGTFTIPLMKRTGYKDHVAGAIEAVASTGGQLMPPVMGAAAFIMAELINTPYKFIALAAVIPSALYYASLFAMVHFEAVKTGLKGMDASEIPDQKKTWALGWHTIICVVVLVALLSMQFSPMYAAFYASLSAIIVSWLRPHTRMNFKSIFETLAVSAKNVLPVAVACATAGIVSGIVSLTGLGLKISTLIVTLSGGNLLLALVLTMITVLILGMGLPTAAAYILVAALVGPALSGMGISDLSAHMFIFYGAMLSSITPPVAIAAYAAAGIAKADPMKIGWTAVRFGLVAFIIPFFFVYQPTLLWQGTFINILWSFASGLIGSIALAVGIQGFMRKEVSIINRIIIIAGSLMLIYPGLVTDIIGFGLIIAGLITQVTPGSKKVDS